MGTKNATLSIMVGGPDAVFSAIKPLFEERWAEHHPGRRQWRRQTIRWPTDHRRLNIEAVAGALLRRAGAGPARVRRPAGRLCLVKILEVHAERMIKRTFDRASASPCTRRT